MLSSPVFEDIHWAGLTLCKADSCSQALCLTFHTFRNLTADILSSVSLTEINIEFSLSQRFIFKFNKPLVIYVIVNPLNWPFSELQLFPYGYWLIPWETADGCFTRALRLKSFHVDASGPGEEMSLSHKGRAAFNLVAELANAFQGNCCEVENR